MSRTLALIRKDFLFSSRDWRSFSVRFVYAAIACTIVGGLLLLDIGTGSRTVSHATLDRVGRIGFSGLVTIQAIVATFLAPAIAMHTARQERQLRTSALLVMTRIHPHELVAGKIAGVVFLLVELLLSVLPVMALLSWFGGMDLWFGAEATALALSLVLIGSAYGLWQEFSAPIRLRSLPLAALPLVFLLLFLVQPYSWTSPWNPFVAMYEVANQYPAASRTCPTAWACLPGIAGFLLYGGLSVRSAATTSRAGAEKRQGRGHHVGSPRRVSGNPLAWLILATQSRLVLPAAAIFGSLIAAAGSLPWLFEWGDAWIVTGLCILVGGLFLVPVCFLTTFFPKSRRTKTLGLIFQSPLTRRQIVHGIYRAAFVTWGAPVLFMAAAWLSFLFLMGDLRWIWFGANALFLLTHVFLLLELGLLYSLRARRSSSAIFLAILTTLVLYFWTLASTGIALYDSEYSLLHFGGIVAGVGILATLFWPMRKGRPPRFSPVVFAMGLATLLPAITGSLGPGAVRMAEALGFDMPMSDATFLCVVVFNLLAIAIAVRLYSRRGLRLIATECA